MNFDWKPSPMTDRVFPPDVRLLVVDGAEERRYASQKFALRQHVLWGGNEETLVLEMRQAVQWIDMQITEALLEADVVADSSEYSLDIIIEARVKTWPRLPGITVPETEKPMRTDAS